MPMTHVISILIAFHIACTSGSQSGWNCPLGVNFEKGAKTQRGW